MGGELSSSQASSSPSPVLQRPAYLSLWHLTEPGLHGGAQAEGWTEGDMPFGALGPNTCRQDQSPRWGTSALPLCADHDTTIPATPAPQDTKNVRWA